MSHDRRLGIANIGTVEGWLARGYERTGARYPWWVAAVIVVEIYGFCIAIGTVLAAHYLGLSAVQTLVGLLASAAAGLVGLILLLGVLRAEIGMLRAWTRGDAVDAEAVGAAAQALPRRLVRVGLPLILIVVWPTTLAAFNGQAGAWAAGDVAGFAVGVAMMGLTGVMLIVFTVELAARPLLADVARVRPSANRARDRIVGLTGRLILGIVAVAVLAGVVVGALHTERGAGGVDLLHTELVSLGATAVTLSVVSILLALPVLEPVRDLTRAARRVTAGDLSGAVPVTSSDELGELAEAFNDMVGGLRDREALRAANIDLSSRIVATADAERRRMERDLHDGAQQQLVLVRLKLGNAARSVEDPTAAAQLAEAQADLTAALDQLRELAHGIYPAVLESDGLPGALADAARRSVLPARVDCDRTGRYAPRLEAAVYFCCLEALQNAAKHAGPGACLTITLAERDGCLEFTIADDGVGFEPGARSGGAGLQNMADRVRALGGTLRVNSASGAGTTVAGRVPLA